MGSTALCEQRTYVLEHPTQQVQRQVRSVRRCVNGITMERQAAGELNLNEIGAVVIDTHSPLFVDPYQRNRATGSFVLIDPVSNSTVAAGMITGRDPRASDISPRHDTSDLDRIPQHERQSRHG